jgi:hypothetical protein
MGGANEFQEKQFAACRKINDCILSAVERRKKARLHKREQKKKADIPHGTNKYLLRELIARRPC